MIPIIKDENLERVLLASAMISDANLEELARSVEAEMFYNVQHRAIANKMFEMVAEGSQFDMIMLMSELGESYAETILGLTNNQSTTKSIDPYCKKLNDLYLTRSLVVKCSNIIGRAGVVEDYSDFVLDSMNDLTDLPTAKIKGELKHITDYRESAISEWKDSAQGVAGVKCGMPVFDNVTGGFRAGEYIVVAARPGAGKTSLAITMGVKMAQLGKKVGYYSIEMRGEEVFYKSVSILSRDYEDCFPYQCFRGTQHPSEKQTSVFHAVNKTMDKLPFYINDSSRTSIVDLEVEVRAFIKKKGLDIVFIDYISLLKGGVSKTRWEKIQQFSMSLKSLFRDMKIPGVVISQLSRDAQNREPTLSDLRESGQIEQDADMVYAIHQEDPNNNKLRKIIGLKGRNVARGSSVVEFCTRTTMVGGIDIEAEGEAGGTF